MQHTDRHLLQRAAAEYKTPELLHLPERINEAVSVVAFDSEPATKNSHNDIRVIGSFSSGTAFKTYLRELAESQDATLIEQEYTLYHAHGGLVEQFVAMPIGVPEGNNPRSLDCPVAIFQYDKLTGLPVSIGAFRSKEEFIQQIVWTESEFTAKDSRSGVYKASADQPDAFLRERNYIAVEALAFIR